MKFWKIKAWFAHKFWQVIGVAIVVAIVLGLLFLREPLGWIFERVHSSMGFQ